MNLLLNNFCTIEKYGFVFYLVYVTPLPAFFHISYLILRLTPACMSNGFWKIQDVVLTHISFDI